jgi:trk system potassium uptake protein TrkA
MVGAGADTAGRGVAPIIPGLKGGESVRVVIGGCGRVGSELARHLADMGDDVSVIDDRPGALDRLGSTFDGTVHEGRIYDVKILEEAGIGQADAFVAVHDSDNANLMAVEVAKEVFAVPRAIARLGDPAREEAYRALDVDYVAGAKVTAEIFFERLREEQFAYHVTFTGGDVQIIEAIAGEAAAGRTVADLEVADRFRIAAVRRGTTTYIPDPDFLLEPGDLVVAAARSGVGAKIIEFLQQTESR